MQGPPAGAQALVDTSLKLMLTNNIQHRDLVILLTFKTSTRCLGPQPGPQVTSTTYFNSKLNAVHSSTRHHCMLVLNPYSAASYIPTSRGSWAPNQGPQVPSPRPNTTSTSLKVTSRIYIRARVFPFPMEIKNTKVNASIPF